MVQTTESPQATPVGRVRKALRQVLHQALDRVLRERNLEPSPAPDVQLEVPREREHGDFATNLALSLAGALRTNPRQLAEALTAALQAGEGWPALGTTGVRCRQVAVAGPGFINFHLEPDWLTGIVAQVRTQDQGYGQTASRSGKLLLEFVSANPVGPITVVQARAGAVGDTLAGLLAASGATVAREYYVNDWTNQARVFAATLEARFRQLLGEAVELPAGGYRGGYVQELAAAFLAEEGDRLKELSPQERLAYFLEAGCDRMVEQQQAEMARYRIHFDQWFKERSLYQTGAVARAVELLKEKGYTYEAEGALWLKSTQFGDDKDRVLVKSDAGYTYVAPDAAYHGNKFERGFDHLIDILGPDHHGYITRLRAAVAALGYPADALEIVIVQQVNLVRAGESVQHSKRQGNIVPIGELLDEVGVDAARYFFVSRAAETPLDFDLDLARLQSNENPVYYVQYAHARICSLLRRARRRGALGEGGIDAMDPDLTLLKRPEELELMRRLADLPDEIVAAADAREPHRMTIYLRDVAERFHTFYTECRVLGEEPPLTAARLALADATRIVVRNVLEMLKVEAPDKM